MTLTNCRSKSSITRNTPTAPGNRYELSAEFVATVAASSGCDDRTASVDPSSPNAAPHAGNPDTSGPAADRNFTGSSAARAQSRSRHHDSVLVASVSTEEEKTQPGWAYTRETSERNKLNFNVKL